MTDDITHSTQYYIEYVNRAALANLLKLFLFVFVKVVLVPACPAMTSFLAICGANVYFFI